MIHKTEYVMEYHYAFKKYLVDKNIISLKNKLIRNTNKLINIRIQHKSNSHYKKIIIILVLSNILK